MADKPPYFNKTLFMKRLLFAASLLITVNAFGQASLGVTKLGQQTYTDVLNDVWGYVDSVGNEYALVGLESGLSIVDITSPASPVETDFVAGKISTWRDIKTWDHYAYVVHDLAAGGSDGILIVDMNTVNTSNLGTTNYFPTVTVGGNTTTFSRAHNIYIDENGVLYCFGSNVGVGGALMFDVAANPTNPPFLGAVNAAYYHDGVARGDTLWGAAIQSGIFQVVDVSNKSNPVVWASQSTPTNFTHNIWFSDDNQTVFTTDEIKGAFVTAYDVSDLNNITELDRIQTGIFDGSKVIPHNAHVQGDFVVTSYYTSGLQIVDASHPDILVETAYYDTSPLSGDGYNGAWGAYPFLPGGRILVSDRQEGLFILQTDYPRASFFTAFVKDSVTNNPIVNANVEMLGSDIIGTTNIFGNFRDGQRDTGIFSVVVTKIGYHTDTISVTMHAGVVSSETVALLPIGFSLDERFGDNLDVVVYPNPSADQLTVELAHYTQSAVTAEVMDVNGRKVMEVIEELHSGRFTFDHELSAGVYFVKVRNGGESYTAQKFVVAP